MNRKPNSGCHGWKIKTGIYDKSLFEHHKLSEFFLWFSNILNNNRPFYSSTPLQYIIYFYYISYTAKGVIMPAIDSKKIDFARSTLKKEFSHLTSLFQSWNVHPELLNQN
jgi:hypothetical protein